MAAGLAVPVAASPGPVVFYVAADGNDAWTGSLAVVHEEGRGDSIRVTDELAAGGQRSLQFTDAPGLEHTFNSHLFYTPNPHLFCTPHLREGRAVVQFDLRLGQGAVVAHEWRDATSPYRAGPSLRIDAAGSAHAGKHLTDVPLERWVRFEIACGLGKGATGTYDLTITLPGEPPRRFPGLACGADKFNLLEWLGFVSLAPEKAVFHLDHVKLDVAPSTKEKTQ